MLDIPQLSVLCIIKTFLSLIRKKKTFETSNDVFAGNGIILGIYCLLNSSK